MPKTTEKTPKRWVVTTSSDRPVGEIAKELSAAGFKVEQTMEQIGVITGKANDKDAKKVRSIRGVTNVSADAPVNIGPPNSRDTW